MVPLNDLCTHAGEENFVLLAALPSSLQDSVAERGTVQRPDQASGNRLLAVSVEACDTRNGGNVAAFLSAATTVEQLNAALECDEQNILPLWAKFGRIVSCSYWFPNGP